MISLYYSKILYMIETENYVECLNTIYDKKNDVLNNKFNKFEIKPILLLAIEAYCLYKLKYYDSFFNLLDEISSEKELLDNEQGKEFVGMILTLGSFHLLLLDKIQLLKYEKTLTKFSDIQLVNQLYNNIIQYNNTFNIWKDNRNNYDDEINKIHDNTILYITEVIKGIFDTYFKKIYKNLKVFLI